jgi:hypothetical protein
VGFIHDAQVEVDIPQLIQDFVLAGDKIDRCNALRRVFPNIPAIGDIDTDGSPIFPLTY